MSGQAWRNLPNICLRYVQSEHWLLAVQVCSVSFRPLVLKVVGRAQGDGEFSILQSTVLVKFRQLIIPYHLFQTDFKLPS
jgi:hypothetical protein